MADDRAYPQSGGQSARTGAERGRAESVRRAWAKPVVQRFSLQQTLGGSGKPVDNSTPSGSN